MTLIAYVIQTINLVGALVAIGLIIVIARQYVVARLALVFPTLWAGFGIWFFTSFLLGNFTAAEFTLWSSIYRSISLAMVLSNLVALWSILADGGGLKKR